MAEVPNRMDWEGKIGKDIAKLLRRQMGALLELMGDPPDLVNVPEAFWVEHGEEMRAALQRNFQQIYLASAEQVLLGQPIGIEWGIINQGAIQWSSQYSFDLIADLTATTRAAVRNAVGSFFEDQLTMGDLRNMLSQTFGPVRADMIASTEVTRAAVQGELAFVAELRKEGVELVARWQTNVDESVCPICLPLNETLTWVAKFPSGPPAHVRCRCWINHEFADRRGEVIGA